LPPHPNVRAAATWLLVVVLTIASAVVLLVPR